MGKKKILAKKERTCRVCGCTDKDCRQCIEKTGFPCYWVEPDLCSACTIEIVQIKSDRGDITIIGIDPGEIHF